MSYGNYDKVPCMGKSCPNRGECRHYADYVNKTRDAAPIPCCRNGKMFVRACDDHPQHQRK